MGEVRESKATAPSFSVKGLLLAAEDQLKHCESADPEMVSMRQTMRYLITAMRELAGESR